MKYLIVGLKDIWNNLNSRIARDVCIFILSLVGIFCFWAGAIGMVIAPGWVPATLLIAGIFAGITVRGYYLVKEGKA